MLLNAESFLPFLAAIILIFCSSCYGQALEMKLAVAKLPSTRRPSAAVYDGDDHIYILGG
jgi:hypothetical protein